MQILLKDVVETYQGRSFLIICFLIAIVYIVCIEKEMSLKRQLMVAAMAILFVFNNIALTIWKDMINEEILFDFAYAVPVITGVAYAVCSVFYRINKVIYKVVFVMAVLLMSGVLGVAAGFMNKDDNLEAQTCVADVEDIANYFKRSFNGVEDRPVVLCTQYCYDEMKTFVPFMLTAIGNREFADSDMDKDSDEYAALQLVNYGIWDNRQRAKEAMDNMGVDYIVISNELQVSDYFAKLGFFKIVDTQTISLYERQDYDINHGLEGYVRRLYYYLLKRQCTEEELELLTSMYSEESKNYGEIAMMVIDSEEYEQMDYSHDEYIYILFEAIQNREPNEGDILFMKSYLGDIRDKRFIVEQYINGDAFEEIVNN